MNILPKLENEELKLLYKKQWLRPLLGILRVYTLLILVIAIAINLGGFWLIPAIVIIGALQHAMSILQHEAVHTLLFPNKKINEFVGTYLISYPIGFSLDYRKVHLNHHRYLGTESDPDETNYRDFPNTKSALIKKIIFEFSGLSALKQFLGSNSNGASQGHFIGIALTQFIIFCIFFLVKSPFLYFVLWLIPLVTVTKGLAQIRNLAEHLVRKEPISGAERIRTFKSSRVERFFLAPFNFNYHAEHHWYPMVPYYNLPSLRKIIKDRDGYKEGTEWSESYIKTIKQAVV